MPRLQQAAPQISVHLYKTISRKTIDGNSAVSTRYAGKDEYIDLTPFLGDGSSVRTTKSVREPAGGFSITFMDKGQGSTTLETIYGLVEPMDVVEIRMWGGTGDAPATLPIVMRGFVTEVQRQQGVSDNGQPQRQVMVIGQDYGKIWQTYQVLYLQAYVEGKALLSAYNLWELVGLQAENTMKSSEFIRQMVEKVINPHIAGFMPEKSTMPKEIKTGDSISVKHGVVNNSYQSTQGSIYNILATHGDVGHWNELYTEDREDGVHCVYRPIPAMHITKPEGAKDRLIQDDATMPPVVPVPDSIITGYSTSRSDATVANFYWVNNQLFDLLDDMQRKLASLPKDKLGSRDYPNAAVRFYGTRAMYAETRQGGDKIKNLTPGLDAEKHEVRSIQQKDWIDNRRQILFDMNKDNVVLERGSARIKGGLMRPDGKELLKAGDYAEFQLGRVEWPAYVTQVDHEFAPFGSYTQTLYFERGEGFVRRTQAETGIESPWLAEQASRNWSA
jgi:hypothetical protein